VNGQINVGDTVVLKKLPPWIKKLPKESQDIITYCVGRSFRVEQIDEQNLLILDIHNVVDKMFGGFMNDIRVESEFVEKK
jgi:hypothetical protein